MSGVMSGTRLNSEMVSLKNSLSRRLSMVGRSAGFWSVGMEERKGGGKEMREERLCEREIDV